MGINGQSGPTFYFFWLISQKKYVKSQIAPANYFFLVPYEEVDTIIGAFPVLCNGVVIMERRL